MHSRSFSTPRALREPMRFVQSGRHPARDTVGMRLPIVTRKADPAALPIAVERVERMKRRIAAAHDAARDAGERAARLEGTLAERRATASNLEARVELRRASEEDFQEAKRALAAAERDHANAQREARVQAAIAAELQADLDAGLASGAVERAQAVMDETLPAALDAYAAAIAQYKRGCEAIEAARREYAEAHKLAPDLLPASDVPPLLTVGVWQRTRVEHPQTRGSMTLQGVIDHLKRTGHAEHFARHDL